jgi:hypothetical protein
MEIRYFRQYVGAQLYLILHFIQSSLAGVTRMDHVLVQGTLTEVEGSVQ